MGKKTFKNSSVSRSEFNKLKKEVNQNKTETKVLDIISQNLDGQYIGQKGMWNGASFEVVELTRGFSQGLLNTDGNIDGNYCMLRSMDLRIQMINVNSANTVDRIRLMLIRIPSGSDLTAADVQQQILAYGDVASYGQRSLVSPYKMNTEIVGGYDVMYDKVHYLTSQTATYAPQDAYKYVRIKKEWKNGLELRFDGTPGALVAKQNRLFLFAFDPIAPAGPIPPVAGSKINFVNRIRYTDE